MKKTQEVRHTRDVNAGLRAAQALNLRKLGYNYDDIAKQCGYSNRGSCWNAVQRELSRTLHESVEALRKVEAERLNDLERVFMLRAMKGEERAALMVLRISERRAKLLGIDITPEEEGDKGIVREYIGLDLAHVVGSNGHTPLALPDAGSRN